MEAQHDYYVLQVFASRKKKIQEDIEQAFLNKGLQDHIKRIRVLADNTEETKKSFFKKGEVAYVVVQVNLHEPKVKETLLGVRGIIGIETGGSFNKKDEPMPLPQKDVDKMFSAADEKKKAHYQSNLVIQKGEKVQITTGFFQGYEATVQNTDNQTQTVEVLIPLFKKESKLKLKFSEVKKI